MLKKLLFVIVLVAGMNFVSLAQGKTEIALITFQPAYRELYLQTSSPEIKRIEVTKDQIKGNSDFSAALKEATKMTEEGWEIKETNVLVTGSGIFTFSCTLTRKKS